MFKKIMVILVVLGMNVLLVEACSTNKEIVDCELTKEYKVAKWEFEKSIRQTSQECKNSISQAHYWYAYWQCLETEKKLSTPKTLCARDAAHNSQRYKKLDIDPKICEPFDVNSELVQRELVKEIARQGIKKCK